MPFASLERPALGLSLLQAQLRRRGFHCDVRYLGYGFADFIGLEDYQWIHGELPYTAFAGDWSFTPSLYGRRPDADAGYITEVLGKTWHLDRGDLDRILRIRAYCEHFLEHCMASIPWSDYEVVGFTSTFEQNIASLALARRVKEAHPEILITFGGANWEDEMGQTLHRQFPFVDFVCSGEADESFPALLECIRIGGDPARIPGVVFRRRGRTVATGPPVMIQDLDSLPFPDYDDFIEDLQGCAAAADVTPVLLIETSRGCWWGAKQHCTFCGLNGGSMAFRSKTAERALEEIHHLRERYGADSLSVVDNILDMRYFKTLFPMIVDEGLRLNLFYEVKANLTHEQIRQLAEAGVRHIQPGVESLSDHVLRLMRKGTTALQNVQLLKWCREFGVKPEWNLLYGFPREDPEDYRGMLPLMEAIDFLEPPGACGPVRLDRFSPYHSDPAGLGMANVRPQAPYRYLYPFEHEDLMRTAYYFDFEFEDGRDPIGYAGPVIDRARRWADEGQRGGLWVLPRGDGSAAVVDSRPGRPRGFRLDGWRAAVYLSCDRVHTARRLQEVAGDDVPPDELAGFLEWCVARGLMANVGDRYLSLAVHRPARTGGAGQPAREDMLAEAGAS
jgi:ribosomal peptide maturation radical SAM protein 1